MFKSKISKIKLMLFRFIIPFALLSISLTSFFADITYEGARSVLGIYLGFLGASALIIGVINVGEFLGYVTRLLSGYVISKKRSIKLFWFLLYSGYFLNLTVVPLLAFAGNYALALLLSILERIGKGIRTPIRDYLIAEISAKIGRGKGFGFHEALDQAGAFVGPAIISSILLLQGSYFLAFLLLIIPASLSMLFLYTTQKNTGDIKLEVVNPSSKEKLDKRFWIYTASMCFLSIALIPWPIASYHLKFSFSLQDFMIALFYSIVMASDGIFSIPLGIAYDKFRFSFILLMPLITFIVTFMYLYYGEITTLIIASIVLGVIINFNESVMRAIVADLTDKQNRAYAYGTFGFFFGLASLIAGFLYGFLYNFGILYLVLLSLISAIVALMLFLFLMTKRSG